jgi:hypothetical protein
MLFGRHFPRRGMRRADAVALVGAAYRFVLGREPDEAGLASYASALRCVPLRARSKRDAAQRGCWKRWAPATSIAIATIRSRPASRAPA